MPSIEKILQAMRSGGDVRFADALKVCTYYFGKPRTHGSHNVFKTPWIGDPRINIQDRDGYVARYQISQIIAAVDRMENEHDR